MSEETSFRSLRSLRCLRCEACCDYSSVPSPLGEYDTYTWTVPDARSLYHTTYAASSPFVCGGYRWRLHVHVFQVKQQRVVQSYVAVYVEWKPSDDPPDQLIMHFRLTLRNSKQDALVHKQRCTHRFLPYPNTGFTLIIPIQKILDVDTERNVDDGFTVNFRVNEHTSELESKTVSFGTYGFNVLSVFALAVRYLYHIHHFRRVMEKLNTTEDRGDIRGDGIRLIRALKKIFEDIRLGLPDSIDIMMLFKAYGSTFKDLGRIFEFWEFFQYFTWRMATCWEHIEDSPFHLLFVGRYVHSFRSIRVAHVREFEVLQLDTIDSCGIYEALNNACTLEDGQPLKAMTQALKVQRQTQLSQFPPVLRLILKRFKYDAFQGKNLKLLHAFEFPIDLQITHDTFHHLAVTSTGFKEHRYKLTSVIAHEGNSLKNGYYVMYVRSNDNRWMKLSDSTSVMTEEQVMETCTRSACFLSYVRMSDWDWVMN